MTATQTVTVAGEQPVFLLRDYLRKARDHAGLTQAELADQLGMTTRSVIAYEGGARAPRRPILVAWAMATGVASDWLEAAPVDLADTQQPNPNGARPYLPVSARVTLGAASAGVIWAALDDTGTYPPPIPARGDLELAA